MKTGYLFDALVLDDKPLRTACDLTLPQRLERALYLSGHLKLVQKYVDGVALLAARKHSVRRICTIPHKSKKKRSKNKEISANYGISHIRAIACKGSGSAFFKLK